MTDRRGTDTPSWPEIIRSAIEAALLETNTGLPGRVESYDASTQTAKVLPLLRRAYRQPDESVQVVQQPPLIRVPVLFPGGNGWSIRWRLKAGDTVFLHFGQRSLDKWKSAPRGTLVDPQESRRHALSDAVAHPELRPPSDPVADPGEDLVLSHDSGNTELRLTPDGQILFGPDATRGVARLDDQTLVDGATDPAFIQFLATVAGAINGLAPGSIPSVPTSVTGKVSSASGEVKSK